MVGVDISPYDAGTLLSAEEPAMLPNRRKISMTGRLSDSEMMKEKAVKKIQETTYTGRLPWVCANGPMSKGPSANPNT